MEEMFMKIKPMNDRVIVRRVEEEQKTAGGIIIPDTAKEKPQEGEVVAIGPGKRDDKGNRIALEVKEGDRILFGKYAGTDIKFDGEEHVFMREDDILGILS
jgi:chaperonin GroES